MEVSLGLGQLSVAAAFLYVDVLHFHGGENKIVNIIGSRQASMLLWGWGFTFPNVALLAEELQLERSPAGACWGMFRACGVLWRGLGLALDAVCTFFRVAAWSAWPHGCVQLGCVRKGIRH